MRYDVVILGGGPAGTATALSLRELAPSLSVALIEQSRYDETRVGETLPPPAQAILEQLGVWQTFLNEGHLAAYGTCAAWGSDELYENEFIFQPAGRGWHLDRKRFDAMLAREASSRAVALYRGSKFIGSQRPRQERWRLTVQNESRDEISIEAKFVVDATGRRAVFASQQDVRKIFADQLVGVFVFFGSDPARPFADTYTLVEACETGWWYSALVPEQKLAVAFMSDGDVIKQHRLNSPEKWFKLLAKTRHTQKRSRRSRPLTKPAAHAAYSHRLENMCCDGWLAVGDAATTFDPLSSLGVVKSLRSGVMAAYAINDYFKGTASGLQKYEALLKEEFEKYLVTRADYYRRERRWENSIFWQRRYDFITLDPGQVLSASEAANKPAALEKLSRHLSIADLKYLCDLCAVPRPAHEIVRAFKAENNVISDQRVILALQYLLHEGLIKATAA